MKQPEKLVETLRKHPKLLEAYSIVHRRHRERRAPVRRDLPDADKKALIAFLATL